MVVLVLYPHIAYFINKINEERVTVGSPRQNFRGSCGSADELGGLEEERRRKREAQGLDGLITHHMGPTGHRGVPIMRMRHDGWAISAPRPPGASAGAPSHCLV